MYRLYSLYVCLSKGEYKYGRGQWRFFISLHKQHLNNCEIIISNILKEFLIISKEKGKDIFDYFFYC